ncbi:hypothetical protein [Bremerella cremea]|uniref:hypothetical protein n=1 Tax=Bremerella cremea TaxID=1031537 RepID=UPI0031EED9E1
MKAWSWLRRTAQALSGSLLIWGLVGVPVDGAVIYLKGQAQPLVGFVEASDDVTIRLRVTTPDGDELHRQIRRNEIELLLQPVNPTRLSQLSPDNPKAYREYAEELVTKTSDPEAVETAKRLFLIAAYLDPEKEGRSAMLGMAPLADGAQGIKQLRALAFLIDPIHDASLLDGNQQEEASGAVVDDTARNDAIHALQLLRRGDRADARQQLQRDEIKSALRSGTKKITWDDCMALIQGTCPGCEQGAIPAYMLQKLVAAELELSSSQSAKTLQPQWGFFLDGSFQKPLPVLSLEKATPYDPKKCLFRDGQWVEPPAK